MTEGISWTPDGTDPVPEPGAHPKEDAIISAISTVYDPDISINIYELGLIYAVEIDEADAVKVEMTLTSAACPAAQELPVQVRDAVMTVPGVTACQVDMVWDPPWGPDRMSDDARLSLNMF